MLMAEEELAIQVAEVYGIEIDNVDFSKAGEDEVLQQFAADATGANH